MKDNNQKAVKAKSNNGKSRSAKAGNDIMSIYMLLVVISGAYAVYVVCAGTEGVEPKIMVAPLASWLSFKLIRQFTK